MLSLRREKLINVTFLADEIAKVLKIKTKQYKQKDRFYKLGRGDFGGYFGQVFLLF